MSNVVSFDDLFNELPESEQAEIRAMAAKDVLEFHIGEIRKYLKVSQLELASRMGVKQPTISSLEKQGKDIRLLSIKNYVEALGGSATIDINIGGEKFAIPL